MVENKMLEKGHLIDFVAPGSPAAQAGISAGWKLLRIDSQKIKDIIDFRIFEADVSLKLLLIKPDGKMLRKNIKKDPGTTLGLRFNPITIDSLQLCPNNCIFCFIDQNPKGLRPPLYVKDDDYRLSFLYGNFITLNRLTDNEMRRIIRLQLSPLYVSLHTTNPHLRNKMFGTNIAEKGLKNFKRLIGSGIKVHVQIVLCPDINTGSELERTINDLGSFDRNILSVALVPVGLTNHRKGLTQIRKFSVEESRLLIEQTKIKQEKYLKTHRSRFIFLSDEFYNLADIPYPEDEEYEGYPQLENGVGLARHFIGELTEMENQKIEDSNKEFMITIAGGKAAQKLLLSLKNKLLEIKGLKVKLVCVENRFFGNDVTVSGLLTGRDLLKSLENREKGDIIFIANNLLRDTEDLFLDDLSLTELQEKLAVPIKAVSGPLELLKELKTAINDR
jgi:putative radical SAM enzyme (TIGR03279 family)